MPLLLQCLSSVSHAAPLLHIRRGPPQAHYAAHRQKRGDCERGKDKVPGESADRENDNLTLRGALIYPDPSSSSAGCEEQILQQEAARNQPHPSSQVGHRKEHGSCGAHRVLRQNVSISGLFHLHFILQIPVEKLVFNKMIFTFFWIKTLVCSAVYIIMVFLWG